MKPMRGYFSNGFTLIELMITCAIVAILAAVAYPAYTNSVTKGKRAQGRTAVLDLLQQQERYLTQNGTYLSFSTGATGTPFKTTSGDNPSQAAYRLGAGACAAGIALNECVMVTAVPNATDTAVGNLWATSTGQKSCSGTSATTNNPPCW